MKRRSVKLTAFMLTSCSFAFVFGCMTGGSSDKQADLDVDMRPKPASGIVDDSGPEPKLRPDGFAADGTVKWQQFFKAPPTVDERSMLEKKLKAWSQSQDVGGLLKKAQNEIDVGKLVAAEVTLREALRLNANHIEVLLELSALQLRLKKTAQAFEILTQLKSELSLQRDVSKEAVFRHRYILALAMLARGDRDKGHKILSDLIGVEKAFAPGYVALAASYLGMGRDNVAEFIAKRGVDRAPPDAALYNILGVVADRRQDASVARSNFSRALEISPTFGPALVNRAAVAMREGETAAAEEDLLRALLYNPANGDALVALGVLQRRTGRLEAARSSLEKAVAIDPESAVARFNLAVLMVTELKKPAVARRLFNEVLQTSSVTPEMREYARNYLSDLEATTDTW